MDHISDDAYVFRSTIPKECAKITMTCANMIFLIINAYIITIVNETDNIKLFCLLHSITKINKIITAVVENTCTMTEQMKKLCDIAKKIITCISVIVVIVTSLLIFEYQTNTNYYLKICIFYELIYIFINIFDCCNIHESLNENIFFIKTYGSLPNETECSICIEKYTDADNVISLQCNHNFHKECIEKWLNINLSCPYCRNNTTSV